MIVEINVTLRAPAPPGHLFWACLPPELHLNHECWRIIFLQESIPLSSLTACSVFAVKKFFLMSVPSGNCNNWGFWLFLYLLISKVSWRFGAGARFLLFFKIQIPIGILEWLVGQASLQCGLMFIQKLSRETECSRMMLSQLYTCPHPSCHSLLQSAAFPSLTPCLK